MGAKWQLTLLLQLRMPTTTLNSLPLHTAPVFWQLHLPRRVPGDSLV